MSIPENKEEQVWVFAISNLRKMAIYGLKMQYSAAIE